MPGVETTTHLRVKSRVEEGFGLGLGIGQEIGGIGGRTRNRASKITKIY